MKNKIVCFIFCCIFPLCAYSSHYTVGTEDIQYYPHYGKLNDQTPGFSGYAKEVLDQFSQQQKLSFSYKFYPIKRLYQAFEKDQAVDFKYPDNPKWNYSTSSTKKITYSVPLGSFIDGTVVLKKNKHFTLNHIKKIGTIKGFTPQAYLDRIQNGEVKLFEFSNTEKLLKALSHRYVDAIYVNIDVVNHQMRIRNVPTTFIKTLPYQTGHYHFSTIKHPELIEKLNAFLNKNAMLLENLKEKYKLSSF